MKSDGQHMMTLQSELDMLHGENARLRERLAAMEQQLYHAQQHATALEYTCSDLEQRITEQATELHHFKTLVEHAPDTIFTIRLDDTTLEYINPFGSAMMGYDLPPIGMPLYQLLPADSPEQQHHLSAMIEQTISTGGWQGLLTYGRQGATPVEALASAFTMRNSAGEPRALAVIIHDMRGNPSIEQQLRKSQTDLRMFYLAVEQSASSILITDTEGIIEYVNPRFTEITGYAADEAIGQTPRLLQSGETPYEVYESLWSSITAGNRWRGEFRNRRKSGEIYWEGASILPITDPAGVITRFLSVSQDITDRKRADDMLRQNEERFRRLAENARDIIFRYRFSPQRGFEYISPSVKTIMGFTPEEYYADPDIDLKRIHPESRTVFAITDDTTESYSERIIMRYVRKDGSDVWIEQNHYQVRDENGKTVAIEGISRDVTDRKRAEEALRNNLQFLETLLDTIPSPVFYKDMQGSYRGCNRLFAKQILGLPDAHITSWSLYNEAETLPLDVVDVDSELDNQLFEARGVQVYVSTVKCADEVYRDFVISRATFVNAEGKAAGIVGVMQDITERIRMEVELKNAYQNVKQLTTRLQDEMNMAHRVQQSLLPPPTPDWHDLDVVCYNRPAREVGGDLYTYYPFNHTGSPQAAGHYSLAVGDVSGKGMPAALLMAVSLASFRSVIEQELTPSDMLAHLDEAIAEHTRTTHQNCAMVYVQITAPLHDAGGCAEQRNGASHTLRVANAGCIFPIIKRSDATIEWVEAGGLPLGIGVGAYEGYEESTLGLQKGDMVILASDGLVEAMNADEEMFGFERLEQVVITGPQQSADAMLRHVQAAVETFIGTTELHDDVTIVIAQV